MTANNTRTVMCQVSKKGLLCLWEQGGGSRNTGDSRIIADKFGMVPGAIYVPRGGHLSNGEHALIPLKPLYYVIDTSHHRGKFEIKIFQVVRLKSGFKEAEVILVNHFSEGEWDRPLVEKLVPAVEAARKKAMDYHCRQVYYANYTRP